MGSINSRESPGAMNRKAFADHIPSSEVDRVIIHSGSLYIQVKAACSIVSLTLPWPHKPASATCPVPPCNLKTPDTVPSHP